MTQNTKNNKPNPFPGKRMPSMPVQRIFSVFGTRISVAHPESPLWRGRRVGFCGCESDTKGDDMTQNIKNNKPNPFPGNRVPSMPVQRIFSVFGTRISVAHPESPLWRGRRVGFCGCESDTKGDDM
ncbi:MAG: hypothetical protein PHR28_04055, partial [candidate division Zixibacteria bacterium]|nr:hypothetical protein [candidate division Zixibacteria bacterium]